MNSPDDDQDVQFHFLFLASGSPRRRDLLTEMGFKFSILLPKVSEIPHESLNPESQILDISKRKLLAAMTQVRGPMMVSPQESTVLKQDLSQKSLQKTDCYLILSADTEVVFEGKLLGKPASPENAFQTLKKLSSSQHQVITGVSLYENLTNTIHQLVDTTIIQFKNLTDEMIWNYVNTNDPMDKAGSYGIQNVQNIFIDSIQGSLDNVIGLPTEQLNKFLTRKKWILPKI